MTPKNNTAGETHLKSPHKKFPLSTALAPRNIVVSVFKFKQDCPIKYPPDPVRPVGNLNDRRLTTDPGHQLRADLRDDAQAQPKFLAALNLIPKSKALEIQNARTISPSLKQRLRSRKDRVTSYFRNNPVPLSSAVGQMIIEKTENGKCSNPEVRVKKYENYCSAARPTKRASPTSDTAKKPWPQVNARRFKQSTVAGNHVHKYSRGKKQRTDRLSEIVIGLNKRSFAALNQCRGFDIEVHRMTDEEICAKIAEVERVPQSLPSQGRSSNGSEVTRWISSEPLPSTSSVIERVATPVVKLYDFISGASMAKKSFKSNKKNSKK